MLRGGKFKMAASSARNTFQWLKQKYSVNVRQEWLDACIEFLKQENRGGVLSQTRLNQLVYEQFLLADLQEISTGCLPTVTEDQDIMTVEGKYCLQINSLINVGQSAYSQIQRMKGKDDPDSLQDKKNNNWDTKVKSSRMLFLQLSDGVQCIQGMEYQPIPCLQPSMPPGTKIQIDGPIMCRLGVLLLMAKNVQVLGGSTEELSEANSMWKILHTAIGQEPPEPPASLVKLEDEVHLPINSQPNTANHKLQLGGNPTANPRNAPSNIINTSQKKSGSNTWRSTSNSINSYVGTGAEIKREIPGRGGQHGGQMRFGQAGQNIQSFTNCNSRSQIISAKPRNKHGLGSRIQAQSDANVQGEMINYCDDDDYFGADETIENFDFDQLDQLEQEVSNVRNEHSTDGTYHKSHSPPDKKVIDTEESELQEFMATIDEDDDYFEDFNVTEPHEEVTEKPQGNTYMITTGNEPRLGIGMTAGMTGSCGLGKGPNTCILNMRADKSELKNSSGFPKTSKTDSISEKRNMFTKRCGMARAGIGRNDGITKFIKKEQSIDSEEAGKMDWKPNASTSAGVKRTFRIKQESVTDTGFASKANGVKKTNESWSSVSSTNKKINVKAGVDSLKSVPFTYLSFVIKVIPFKEDITLRLKAYISTLLAHSQHSDPAHGWCVTVKINDGTATMDVDLGSEVLTELLGFPVADFQSLMQQAKRACDPAVRRTLQQRTEQFQRNLSMVSCLMDVLFSPSRPRPLLIRLTQPSREDIRSLMARIRGAM